MAVIRYSQEKPCQSGQRHLTVVECPPRCRTIRIQSRIIDNSGRAKEKIDSFYLAVPWTVFVVPHIRYQPPYKGTHSAGSCLGFRNSPLTDDDQMLYYPHLYNIYTKCLRICMADVSGDLTDAPNKIITDVLNTFWGSPFMCSGSLHGSYLKNNAYSDDLRVRDYATWQTNTLRNPDFITSVQWKPCDELINIIGHTQGSP